MEQYIPKSALVAAIEKKKIPFKKDIEDGVYPTYLCALMDFEDFINTLEVKEADFGTEVYKYIDEHFNMYDDGNQTLQTKDKKSLIGRVDAENIAKHFYELGLKAQSKDMIEALRTEYEKGRADVIADTLSWLENCWPRYCSNQTIIDGFKEAVKGE